LKTSLIILTRNEIEGLRSVFPRIPLGVVDEVIAVDGNSSDGTIEYLKTNKVKVVQQSRLGRGNAMIEGVRHTAGDSVVFLSSDGNENPADISRLVERLEDAEIAVASRFMKGGRSDDSDDPLLIRRFGNKLMTFLVNLLWRANVTDCTNGLRAIRRDAWKKLGIDSPYHETEFQMTIRAAKLGMKIIEVPTIESLRVGGKRYASTSKMALTFTRFLLREIWIGKSFLIETDEMKREVRRHYDSIASMYEPRKRESYLRMMRQAINELLGQTNGRRIADLGCGTGLALSWLDGDKVGVDFSRELLMRAHRGPDYVLADLDFSPFRAASFGFVLCLDVAEHLPSLNVMREAHRILERDGIFLLSTADRKYKLALEVLERLGLKLPEGPHSWRREDQITGEMTNAGFSYVQCSKAPIRFYKGTKR